MILVGFFVIAICVLAYFVPVLVAVRRKHHNTGAIGALNILLGWTLVGWVVALVWALSNPAPAASEAHATAETRSTSPRRFCRKCGKEFSADAKYCESCGADLAS